MAPAIWFSPWIVLGPCEEIYRLPQILSSCGHNGISVSSRANDKGVEIFKDCSEGGVSHVQMIRIQDYGRIYMLLGIFETRLRISIPSVLSAGDITQSNLRWYETLDLSPKGSDALEKAKFKALKFEGPRKPNRPEHFLHLSFWRYLVRSPYYTSLWVPKLHKGFSGLVNPKSFTTFKELDSRFGRALLARNHIAHYSIAWKCDVDEEIQNLLWLIKALDLELYAGALRLIVDT